MFVRLTRPVRVKAGWFVALLYLFCVLAPGVALAFGDAASCLMVRLQPVAAAHVHAAAASHEHGETHQHHEHHAGAGNATQEHAKHQHDGKGSPGSCCAMFCLSAIAADLPAIAKPLQPISLCVSGNFQHLPGKAPPLLYRPPIA
ncbi:hypothetical protein [Bradyrhizobium valentinum]|uniref:Uncharacterized protein n=1 Tax=Bradyrhizobium valentinum TaxID=1518501 RepID=A0A0R3JY55_9BRAD|nr:hypothetical protein [Bradyrhizobium valentinum]KRQ88449.1 hypothetical protein CP49_20225 [Bradyrhizobium valentinum]KRR07523.1 hypothetical protein CQ10_15695 [Bradyrhizobium valentinum]